VISTLVAATPAILHGATDILAQERLPLWLLGLAATLSMVERVDEADAPQPAFIERMATKLHARRQRSEADAAVQLVQNERDSQRWNSLREEAGVNDPLRSETPAGR
jgi:hypothetical protein